MQECYTARPGARKNHGHGPPRRAGGNNQGASFMYETPAATPMAPCPQASGAERLALPPGSEERAMLSSSNNRLEILRLGPELWTSTYEGTSGLRHAHCVGGARDGCQGRWPLLMNLEEAAVVRSE
jgi:hypothetical protein